MRAALVVPAAGLAAGMLTIPVQGGSVDWNLAAPSRHVERVADAFDGNVRHIVFGDSFAFPNWHQTFPCLLKAAPYQNLTAVCAGAMSSHAYLDLDLYVGGATQNLPVAVHTFSGYQIENQHAPQQHFALPLSRLIEVYCDPSIQLGANGAFFLGRINNMVMEDGATGRFTNAGDELRVRYLYRCATDRDEDQLDSIRLVEIGGPNEAVLDLRQGARRLRHEGEDPAAGPRAAVPRQINAAFSELTLAANTGGNPTFEAREETIAASVDGDYLQSAGHVAYKVDGDGAYLPGQYYSYLADTGWAWSNFGEDAESSTGNKAYSLEQLEHWLDVTTLDPNQKVICWYYVNIENRNAPLVRQDMLDAIDLMNTAAANVGLGEVVHCLIVAHMHYRPPIDETATRIRANETRDNAYAIADERDDVCAISLFDATDGVFFDGRPESVQWLTDNGYDDFTYGPTVVDLTEIPDMLDGTDIHPQSQNAGVFYASFIADAVLAAPPVGDLTGDGVVGFADLTALLASWGDCTGTSPDCPADLDCDGTVGFADLTTLLSGWS